MTGGAPQIPGRFAIDWVKVDATGAIADGDAGLVQRHLGYGAEALAVAHARVVAVRNDAPEPLRVSESVSNGLEAASGNYVILQLARECFAFYEHLMPGSVGVSPGERVVRGQLVGSLGFTGDSTGPHLHFHLARTSSPINGDGIPFSLDQFELLGRYHDLAALGGAPWQPRDEAVNVARVRERPASNAVVAFA
jgi:murein DD-endopeptidase MepM/ murein hydrolase activator NlpD